MPQPARCDGLRRNRSIPRRRVGGNGQGGGGGGGGGGREMEKGGWGEGMRTYSTGSSLVSTYHLCSRHFLASSLPRLTHSSCF